MEEIKEQLEIQLNKFLDTYTPKPFLLSKDDVFIAGGAIASLLRGEEPKDFDFYYKRSNFLMALDTNIDIITNPRSYTIKDTKYQLIFCVNGEPEKVISTFDFLHTKTYYHNKELYLPENVLKSIESEYLIYDGGSNPINSFLRALKFVKRGWKLSNKEAIKILIHIWSLDLSNEKEIHRLFPKAEIADVEILLDTIKNIEQNKENLDTLKKLAALNFDGIGNS